MTGHDAANNMNKKLSDDNIIKINILEEINGQWGDFKRNIKEAAESSTES